MRLPLTVLVLFSVMFGSCRSAPAPGENRLTFFENLGHSGFKFNWRNISCPTCKVLFVIVDIVLLVMFTVPHFSLSLSVSVQSLVN